MESGERGMAERAGSGGRAAGVRLAYLVGQYPAANHTFVLREVQRLRALGFDVLTASVSPPDRPFAQLPPDEQQEAARTFYVKPANPLDAVGPHLKTLAERPAAYLSALARTAALCLQSPLNAPSRVLHFVEAVALGRWMLGAGVGHVHTHFASNVCLVAVQIFPVTMSMTIHGPAEFEDAAGWQLGEKVRRSRFVCAISNYARSQLMRYSRPADWPKISVAPLGVDPGLYAPRPHRESPRPFEIVCVARLAPVKAQHILVAAVARLVAAGRDVRLRLVGGGPLGESLEREVAARGLGAHVRFEGWLTQEQVRGVLDTADAFALASFAEGVPVVLMEAMAREIPCVATFVNGVPELIRDGVDGLLVAPSDAEALADALARLMDDSELRRRLGAAGRRRVEARYDLARNVELLAEVFRRELAGGAAADPPAVNSTAHPSAFAPPADEATGVSSSAETAGAAFPVDHPVDNSSAESSAAGAR